MSVQEPDRIDFITSDAKSGIVWMTMTEERDWATLDPTFPELNAKVNRYLRAFQSGELAQEVPQSRDQTIGIRLFCSQAPTEDALHILSLVKAGCEHFNVRFVVFLLKGDDMREIPLTAGQVSEVRRVETPKKPWWKVW